MIQCSPFYANYGYNPHFTIDPRLTHPKNPKALSPSAAKDVADKLKMFHEVLIEAINIVQNYQAQYYDAKHKLVEFQKGDWVWLWSINICTER